MIDLLAVRKDFTEYLNSLEHLSEQEKTLILDRLFNPRESIWRFLIKPEPKGKALLIGVEWNSVFAYLAENFQEVVVWDVNPLRISILKYFSKLLNLNIYFHEGDFDTFSNSPGYFDLVVLDHSLAWLPLYLEGSPRQIQVAILQSAIKLLNAQGQCFILMQNRFAYERWKGEKGDYVELPFITLLPRIVANGYSWLFKGESLKIYTHSLKSLCRLIKQVGFSHQNVYFLHPHSKNPDQILGWGTTTPSGEGHPITKFLNKTKLGKYFQNSLALVADKEGENKSFIDQLLEELQNKLRCAKPISIERCIVSGVNCGIFFLHIPGGDGAILRLPLDKTSLDRLQNGFTNLQYLKNTNESLSPELIPEQLMSGSFVNQSYFLERRLPGIEALTLIKSPGELSLLIKDAAEIISEINQSGQVTVQIDPHTFDKYFLFHFNLVQPYLEDYTSTLDRILAFLQQTTSGQNLPLVLAHGDFKLANLLIDPVSKRLSGIVDWDMSELSGLPLLDIFHLILSKYRATKFWSIGMTVIHILLPQTFNEMERKIIEDYRQKFNISQELYQALLIMYWVKHNFGTLVETGGLKDPVWLKENIVDVLECIECKVL